MRQTLRETIQEEKSELTADKRAACGRHLKACVSAGASLRGRRAWGSSAAPEAGGGERSRTLSSGDSGRPRPDRVPSSSPASAALSSLVYRPPSPAHVPVVHLPPPVLLLLVSNRIPAYEVRPRWPRGGGEAALTSVSPPQLLLSGLKAAVVAVLYDHRGTQSALLAQVRAAVAGRRAQRLGLLAPGGTQEVHLLHSKR